MISMQNQTIIYGLLILLVIGLLAVLVWGLNTNDEGAGNASSEPEPLYWVAPMDPNYRRDEPGLSPMGMELIPVYAEDGEGSAMGAGTIAISPNLVNNLGVRTGVAKTGKLQNHISTVGYVTYDQGQLVHINPRVAGWIERLYVQASGDPVTGGEPLYEIYSPQLVNAQEELLLALNSNNPQLIKAAEDRLRALQLDPGFIDQLKTDRQVVQHLVFRAPQTGVVDNLAIREGAYVQPGTRLMSIGNLDQVWVEAEVFERQAMLLEPGLPASMTLDYLPGRTWKGEVDYVYPLLDADSRTLRARLRFDNADSRLKPNMFARVDIQARAKHETLLVPRESVIRTGSQDRVVLVLGNGQFKSVEVRLGRSDREFMEILEGIAPGDRVVTSAQFLLDSESSKTSDFLRMESPQSDSLDSDQMDHDQMDHDQMDHDQMDHSQMDHSQMDHDQMDHSQMSNQEQMP